MQHEQFIRESLALAMSAVQKGNEPFGSLLVHKGEVILTAENSENSERDCTKHAELKLVSQSTRMFSPTILAQSILYTSTEPCIMCTGAIHWAGISMIVYSCSQESFEKLATEEYFYISCREVLQKLHSKTQVVGPVLEKEGIELLKNIAETNR